MILVWRDRGLVAVVATFLPLVSCAGLMDWKPIVALECFGVSLLVGGMACRHYGLKWNQGSGLHTMCGIPLETWGWVYIAIGGFFGMLAGLTLVKQAVAG